MYDRINKFLLFVIILSIFALLVVVYRGFKDISVEMKRNSIALENCYIKSNSSVGFMPFNE